jgi:DNA-binding MarR family transcriptional regulator
LYRQRQRDQSEGGTMADTTRGQGRILAVLKLQDGISTKDLSYLLGVSISSMNELLSKLEKYGYIVRESSSQDKRIMLVKLTEKGRNVQQPETHNFGDIFSCLAEEEQKRFGEYLDRILSTLYADTDDGENPFERMEAFKSFFGNMGDFIDEDVMGNLKGCGFMNGFAAGFGPMNFENCCPPASHKYNKPPGSHK